jgi:hypothetical protein
VDSELFYTSLTIAEMLVVDGKLISYVGHRIKESGASCTILSASFAQ